MPRSCLDSEGAFFSGMGPRRVRGAPRPVADEVARRMTLNNGLDAREVTIEIAGKEITLKGSVPRQEMAGLAEEIAASVAGVQAVRNQLRIVLRAAPQPPTDPNETDAGTHGSGGGPDSYDELAKYLRRPGPDSGLNETGGPHGPGGGPDVGFRPKNYRDTHGSGGGPDADRSV